MFSSKEYSSFLKWNPDHAHSADSVAQPFVSLVSMVRDGYEFDEELVRKVSKFLSSVTSLFETNDSFDNFLNAIGQASPDRTEMFVDSITMLFSSPHPSIVKTSLPFIRECLGSCSTSNLLILLSSKLFPRILSTPHLRDLSVIGDQGILKDILALFSFAVRLTCEHDFRSISPALDTDPESIRDVVLHEVLIPIEPALVQISRNHFILSWKDEYANTMNLLVDICDRSASHQPTLDFVCSSHIPIVFLSLLSTIEDEETHQLIIWLISDNIRKWNRYGAETMHRGRILLQTLEKEGFHEGIEQALLHDKSSEDGQNVRIYSYQLMKHLGMNSRLHH